MNFNQLQYLIEIDNCKSMNKAAEKLFITQPALRSAISSLEHELGLPLINRSRQGCTLTDFGNKVVTEARTMLEIYYGWINYKTSQLNLDGEIHIACFSNICGTIFSNFILQFHQQYPQLTLFLDVMPALEALEALRDNRAHLALIMADANDETTVKKRLNSPNWKVSKVYEDGFSIFTHKNSPLLKQEITYELLNQLTFVTFSQLEMLYNPQYSIRKNGFQKNKTIYIDHYSNIFNQLLQSPYSFAILSDIFSLNNPHIQSGDLVTIKAALCDWSVNHYLIEPSDSFCDLSRSVVCTAIRQQYEKMIETF